MKYFLDTEFIEKPGSIQLVSLGIVADDDRTFYAESNVFDERDADEWVQKNVLPKLLFWDKINTFYQSEIRNGVKHVEVYGSILKIKTHLLAFVEDNKPEFWGYYADYDWVVFCWIFGRMIDLPENFPMYCKDLKQSLDESGKDKLPDPAGEHNALVDAKWNKKLWGYIHG